MDKKLISFKNIKKQFGKTPVLKGVDFDIKQGEIFGLLGVNGAGKTTLIRALLGLIRINDGIIQYKDRPRESRDVHENFGFLPENFLPPQNLKAIEFLKILKSGINNKTQDINALIELAGLQEHRNKYIKAYSRGMIQRLGLACALLKDPEVIILDEPTLGLDPLGQRQVLELLFNLNKEGKTIFFSSHILSQIEKVCTRIGILHDGIIKYVGKVEEIINKHKVSYLEDAFLEEIKA